MGRRYKITKFTPVSKSNKLLVKHLELGKFEMEDRDMDTYRCYLFDLTDSFRYIAVNELIGALKKIGCWISLDNRGERNENV